MQHSSYHNYRPDIDGLRAVAILVVLLFHIAPSRFPGGFIGVDIFFVISGFLITGLLKKSFDSNSFSFMNFWQRRISRLYPALLLVISFTIIAGYFLLTPTEYKNLSLYSISGLSYWTNFLLYSETGYFDQAADLKPHLHLWTLAVEEQFYLLYPIILFFSFKLKLQIKKILWSLFLMSFFASVYIHYTNPSFAFYSPFTRFWELILGGIISVSSLEIPKLKFQAQKCLGLIGLSAVIAVTFFYQHWPTSPFFFLIPTLAAATIIAIPSPWTTHIFSKRFLIYIGLFSYPLYLWHWPLLSLLRITQDGFAAERQEWLAGIISVFLAILTYELIEKRTRASSALGPLVLKKNAIRLLGISVLLMLSSYFIFANQGLPHRFKKEQISNLEQFNWIHPSNQCPGLVQDGASVFIIGDSHAEHFTAGLNSVHCKHGISYNMRTDTGCNGLYEQRRPIEDNNCQAHVNWALKNALENPKIKLIIFAARYSNFATNPETAQHLRQQLIDTFDMIKVLKDKRAILIHEVPPPMQKPESCLDLGHQHIAAANECKNSIERVENYFKYYNMAFDGIILPDNVSILDPKKYLCDDFYCYILKDGKTLYRDHNHLSHFGANFIIKNLFPTKQSLE